MGAGEVSAEILDSGASRSVEADLRRLNWALTAYRRSSSALIRSTDIGEIMSGICQAIVLEPIYRLASVGFTNPPPDRGLRVVATAGPARGYMDGLEISSS